MPQEKLITLDNLETFKDKLDVRVNKLVAFNDQNLADNPDVTLTSETPVKIASFDATSFDSLPSTFYFKAEIVERYNEINIVRHYKDGTPSVSGRYPLYSGGVNTFDIDNTDNNIASVDIEGFAGTYFNMMFCVNQNAAYTPFYHSNRQLTHEIRNVSGLALGETSTTAYRGDRGKTAYDHSQTTGNPHGTTKSDVGLGNVGNFKAVSTVASQGLTSTEQSNARANIGAGTSNLTIGTTGTTACAGNDSRLSNARTPTSHAANSTTYGGGTSSKYGHVKLTDTYNTQQSSVAAANSVGASAKAVQDAYNALNSYLQAIYPVGAVYMSTNSTLPTWIANLGTWVEIDAGYFLKAVGSGNTAGSTANAGNTGAASGDTGAATGNTGSTTLTAAQSGVPAHSHSISSSGSHTHTGNDFSLSGTKYNCGAASGSTTTHFCIPSGNSYYSPASISWAGGAHTHTANNNTAKDATSGHTHTLNSHTHSLNSHTHTAGNPASYGLHVWVRTA